MKSQLNDAKAIKKQSAGLLMYKYDEKNELQFFIAHPGGPFWKNKNEGSWTIPKGEILDKEDKLLAAIREFYEETGIYAKEPFINLGFIKQKAGKTVYAWAFEGDFLGILNCTSYCEIEFPQKSGKIITIPEIDKGGFFNKNEIKVLINPAQYELIERLENILNA
jgi:predicted NUDIX family NTP pyrophosphohydrolase